MCQIDRHDRHGRGRQDKREVARELRLRAQHGEQTRAPSPAEIEGTDHRCDATAGTIGNYEASWQRPDRTGGDAVTPWWERSTSARADA